MTCWSKSRNQLAELPPCDQEKGARSERIRVGYIEPSVLKRTQTQDTHKRRASTTLHACSGSRRKSGNTSDILAHIPLNPSILP
eukprot:771280-Amphidinium_carterae.1